MPWLKNLANKQPFVVLGLWLLFGWLAWQLANFAVRGLARTFVWNLLPSSLLGNTLPDAQSAQTLDFLE